MVRATVILVSIKSSLGNAQTMLSRNLICRPYTNSFIHSGDGTTFKTVVLGTWIDDNTLKTSTFTPTAAQYIRIVAQTEAGGRGPWSSCSEINIYTATDPAADANTMGAWGPTIEFPLVPVSAAIEWSSGNLLVWSSYEPSTFGGSNMVQTVTATYDPATGDVTEALITNTDHDMFCEGLSMDFSGQIFATGGNTDDATSYYNSPANDWTAAAVSTPPRAFQEDTSTNQSRGSLHSANSFTRQCRFLVATKPKSPSPQATFSSSVPPGLAAKAAKTAKSTALPTTLGHSFPAVL